MSAVVCDASVIVKLLVGEADSSHAVALANEHRIALPEFAQLEVGNALWLRVHAGECGLSEALELLSALADFGFQEQPIAPLIPRALEIAGTIDHPIYDCLYLALAEHLSVPLVTADRRFMRAVRRARWPSIEVKALSEFA
jgi:predicted nucleic acid-binding protein